MISKLPVFVFIQGGGFNANSNPNLNGTGLIEASDHNLIVVTFNYRVGPWGFLATNSTSNNGLRDQRKALEWVQQHISAFGGDPEHVVLGGDSAGAASIALHLTAYGGRNDDLFHAAAAESVSFATILTPTESEYQYNALAKSLGCPQYQHSESLDCLRNKTAEEIEAHNSNSPYPGQRRAPLFMFNPVLDNDMVTDYTYSAFEKGNFINIPVIFGDDMNGGTIFTPRNINCIEEMDDFLTANFPYLTPNYLTEINKLYPLPSGSHCPRRNECWWRRASNAYGELRYMCPSLFIPSAFANISSSTKPPSHQEQDSHLATSSDRKRRHAHEPTDLLSTSLPAVYAYLYNVHDSQQISAGLGVPHTVELAAIFGPTNVPPGSAPASYFPYRSNENVVPLIQAYWTSFIRTFDPNAHKLDWAAKWSPYHGKDGQLQRLVFQTGAWTQMEKVDTGLRERCAYFESIGRDIRQKV